MRNIVEEPLLKEEIEDVVLPETSFERDIETRVFQAMALQCLAKIEGISLLGGTLIDNLLGREGLERIKGIHVEQDDKTQGISIKVEVNIYYGVSLPEKATEIQKNLVEEITKFTGFHVSNVHVVFKNLILISEEKEEKEEVVGVLADDSNDDFDDGF